MKNIEKKMLAIVLCATLICMLVPSAGAANAEMAQGGVDESYAAKTNAEILEEMLSDPNLTDEAKEKLIEKENLYQMYLQSPSGRAVGDYIVPVSPIKQQTNTWCSAATIQMVLSYMGASYGSQSNIMSEVGAGPGLQTVINYLNQKQSENTYIRKTWNTQDELNTVCRVADMVDIPIVFTFIATDQNYNDGVWPYPTGGHFTVLRGYFASGGYSVADPYYYADYPPYIPHANGLHNRTYEQLKTVNANYNGSNFLAY